MKYLFFLSLFSINAFAGYDSSWYRSEFWSGEYPTGFSVTVPGTVVMGRTRMNKNLKPRVICQMPYLAVVQPWNVARIKKSNIKFYAASKIVKLVAKEDFLFEDDDKKVAITKGDVVEYLQYYAEGSFGVRINGVTYTASQDFLEHFENVTDERFVPEDDWALMNCVNGRRAYIFLGDLVKTKPDGSQTYHAGISEVGPGMAGYGHARDLTVGEARALERRRGQ